MLEAFKLAIGQLSDRKILVLLVKVLLSTLGLLTVLGIGLFCFLTWLFEKYLLQDGGMATAAAATILSVLAALFLFRVIAIFVINIFSDEVVDAVEEKYYPTQAELGKPPIYTLGLKMGLASAGRALGYNAIMIPAYLILLFTAIGPAIAFVVVNANSNFIRELRIGEHVQIRSELLKIGTKSCQVCHHFFLGETEVFNSTFTLVLMNLKTRAAEAIPDDLHKALLAAHA